MLSVRDLHVSYGGIRALKGVSIDVNKGEIVTIIGANGAGKSTLLNAVSGFLKPTKGEVSFKGQKLGRQPAKIVKLGICHVPEGRLVFANLTVQDNLLLGAYLRNDKKVIAEDMEKVYSLFPRLKERLKQPAGTLSGGEQQMLAMARALMSDPKLLMLDEPSMGLAPVIVELIFETIGTLNKQGITILLVEQNAAMALSIADRGYVLETGSVALTGPGKELLHNEQVRKTYLGEA